MYDDREFSAGLLGPDATYRLLVNGPVGAAEISRLIRKSELDRDILAESEAAEERRLLPPTG